METTETPTPETQASPVTQTETAPVPTKAGESKLWAYLAYFFILFIWTSKKEGHKEFFMWHAKNGAGYFALGVALNIVFQLLYTLLPDSLFGIINMVNGLVSLALLVVFVLSLIKVSKGDKFMIPVVSDWAQKHIPLEKWGFTKPENGPAATTTEAPAASPTPTAHTEPEVETPAPVAETPVAVVEPAPTQVEPATQPSVEATPAPAETPVAPVESTPTPVVETPVAEAPQVTATEAPKAPTEEPPQISL